MQTITRHLPLHDDCSGIANVRQDLRRQSSAPVMLGFIMLACAFLIGTAAGALICLAIAKF